MQSPSSPDSPSTTLGHSPNSGRRGWLQFPARGPWRCCSPFILTLAALLAAVWLAPSPASGAAGLELRAATNYTLIWNDRGSGADTDMSVWKPVVPPGYFALGHYATNNYNAPLPALLLARPSDPGALAPPTGYAKIWDDRGSGATLSGSFWRPIPPPGYVSLGDVAAPGHFTPPSTNDVRCVRADLVVCGDGIGRLIWNERGSGADEDASVWRLDISVPPTGVDIGAFVARNSHAPPFPPYYWIADQPPSISSRLWVAQGPAPITNAYVHVPLGEAVGAVEVVLPHPTNANVLYAGAVNGGIWRTTNATAERPTWVPLTDQQSSLSIGALEFDVTDPTYRTLLAGIGRLSSAGGVAGDLTGLLRSTDGGDTWTAIGQTALTNRNITSVSARGNVLMAAAYSHVNATPTLGLWRSTDGGANFTLLSGTSGLPGGQVSDLVADPGNAQRFYVGVVSNGVFRSDNGGATWINLSATLGPVTNVMRIEMAVHHTATSNVVYAGLLVARRLDRVFRSSDFGATWTQLDTPNVHRGPYGHHLFAIAADPMNPALVYISGDYGNPGSAAVVRVDASAPLGSQVTEIATPASTPHADSRAMTFDADGHLIESDDGGVYRADSPAGPGFVDWRSVNGSLQVSEINHVAYDSLSKVVLAGFQDNGVAVQSGPGASEWKGLMDSDGQHVAVDATSTPGLSYRYYSAQNLNQYYGFYRAQFDANNEFISGVWPGLTNAGGSNPKTNAPFDTALVLNAVDPARLIIGGNTAVYESFDRGDNITNEFNIGYCCQGVAYGGRLGGAANPDVLYVGSGNSVFVRTNAGGALAPTPTAFPGGTPVGIVLDATTWSSAYVITAESVYRTPDAGASWTNITGCGLTGAGQLFSIRWLPFPDRNRLAVGTDHGVFIGVFPPLGPGYWTKLGPNLPNVRVSELDYNATDNLLVAGTFGRGVFQFNFGTVSHIVTSLADAGSGSLRQVINTANAAHGSDVITFGVTGTINLASSLPPLQSSTCIVGPGTNDLAINGSGMYSLLSFDAGTTNKISGLRLENALSITGGAAIRNFGHTVLNDCYFTSNFTYLSFGGAVYNGSEAALFGTNCVFAVNAVLGGEGDSAVPGVSYKGGGGGGGAGLGGAIYSEGSVLALDTCVFDSNGALGGAGGAGTQTQGMDYRGGSGGGPSPGLGGSTNLTSGAGGFGSGGGGGAGYDSTSPTKSDGGPGGFGGGGGGAGASLEPGFSAKGGVGGGIGGARYGGEGEPPFLNNEFGGTGGGGAGLGGALFTRTGAVVLVTCVFNGNCATNGHGGNHGTGVDADGKGVGGAIFNLNAALTLVDVDYTNNKASTLDNDFSTPTVVTFEPQTATMVRATWTPASGRLQSAPTVMGPWSNVPGAINGGLITLNLSSPGLFYRVAR